MNLSVVLLLMQQDALSGVRRSYQKHSVKRKHEHLIARFLTWTSAVFYLLYSHKLVALRLVCIRGLTTRSVYQPVQR